MVSTSKRCNFLHSVAKRSRTAMSWHGIWPTRTRLGTPERQSKSHAARGRTCQFLHQGQGKRALFAYDTREVCEADPIGCPRPWLDCVYAPSTNANEPHQAQDLGKRDQEKLVSCNMKSDPKDIHQSQKRLSIT